jgi:hypothetical protein
MGLERWTRTLPLRLRSLFRRSAVEDELDEELRFHFERCVEANLARITLMRGLTPAVGGIALGTMLVLALGRFLDGLLFHASTRDPLAFGTATVVLLLCAFAASLVPAARASRADPKVALTSE